LNVVVLLLLPALLFPCPAGAADALRRAGDGVSVYGENNSGETSRADAFSNEAARQPELPAAEPGNAGVTRTFDSLPGMDQADTGDAASSESANATTPENATAAIPAATPDSAYSAAPESANAPVAPTDAGEAAENVNPPAVVPAKPPVRLIGTVEFRSLIKNLP
jgi:hypothetical protein